MHALRRATLLVRFMLAWFVLSLGVAVAAPAVQAGHMELVCTGAGAVKFVPKGEDAPASAGHTLDCPLCATASAPPPSATATRVAHVASAQPVAVGDPDVARRPVALPPLRGPPARF